MYQNASKLNLTSVKIYAKLSVRKNKKNEIEISSQKQI